MAKRGRKPGGRAPRNPHRSSHNCSNCIHGAIEYAPAAHAFVYSCKLPHHTRGCVEEFVPKTNLNEIPFIN